MILVVAAIKDLKAGKCGARYQVEANDIVKARVQCGLSQAILKIPRRLAFAFPVSA